MKAIVIGGVAAGMSAASKLRRMQPSAEIRVYDRGGFVSYGACGLPYYIGGMNDRAELLIARTREQYAKMGIETRMHFEALRVDPKARRVLVRDLETRREEEDGYDALMIAVGANPVVPRIPGADGTGVFYLRSMEDGLFLREFVRAQGIRRVAIVGGGAIGCEMAEALTALGREVTVIEGGERILLPYEPEFSELAAQELEKNGVSLLLSAPVQAVEEKGGERVVRTARGDVRCDMVLMAVGVVPATDFLKDTGIRTARNGAILVDREMRTSLPDVWAAGDCCAVWHRLMQEDYYLPLGTVANKCGRVAGANMAGAHEKFPGALGTSAVKVFDLEIGRTGMGERDAKRLGVRYKTKTVTAPDHPAYYPDPAKLMIKLIYEEGTRRLLGACCAGRKNAVLRCDVFAVAITAGMTTDEMGMTDLAYAPPFASVWDAVQIAANAAK